MKKQYLKVSEYAELMGVHRNTVLRWVKKNRVSYVKPEKQILIENPNYEEETQLKWVGYARVSSYDQKKSLLNQENAIMKYALEEKIVLTEVRSEIGSGFNERRKIINQLLADPNVNLIIEHRDRLSRSNFNLIKSTLRAQNREILIVDDSEIENDLVQELSEFLMSKCASIYGKRGARKRASQTASEVAKNVKES